MTKFAHLENGQSMKLKLSRGPVARDGKTPFLDGPTAWVTNTRGMKSQITYNPANILVHLAIPDTAEIEVIDEANQSFTVYIRPIDTAALQARVGTAASGPG